MAESAIWAPQVAQYLAPAWMPPAGAMGCEMGWGLGFQTIAMMPPMRPRRNPMKSPPIAPTQLRSEKTMMSAPDVAWLPGFDFSRRAKTMMRTPQTIPRMPTRPPMPANMNVTRAPMTAAARPPMITKMPAMRDSMYAAEGVSDDIGA